MATIVANITPLHTAESVTGAVGNKPVLDNEIFKQGSNSIGFTVTQNKVSGLSFASVDLTGEHVRLWYTSTTFPNMDIKANGGLRFYIKGGGTTAYWNIAGKDTYFGGWLNIVVDVDSTPDSGSFTKTAVTEIGVEITTVTTPRNAVNTWIDYARYGDGLTAYGTPSFSMEDIYQADLAGGYGIVEKNEGVYILTGSIIIGDAASTNATIFEEDGTVYVFADKNVSATLYKLEGVGNATGDTDISFDNCVITSAGPIYDLDFNSADIESVAISGCQISGADEILLDTLCTILGTTFNACGLITVEAATVEDCTVSNPTGSIALKYPAAIANNNTARITFIDSTAGTYAIEISTDVDHTFDGHKFTGGWTAHVHNTSGQAIIVYATNGCTASTFTGTTDIQNSVILTIKGMVEGSVISICRVGTTTSEAYVASSAANGEYEFTYNYPTGWNVDIVVHKNEYRYVEILNYPLTANPVTVPITQVEDRQFGNP